MAKLGKTALRTKHAIMESALKLFDERGFDAVTVEEITAAAGVAKGSFYTYFGTKSDIIVEEFGKIDAFYREWADKNLRRYKTAREKLLAFTRAQLKYVRDTVGAHNLKLLYANQVSQPGSEKAITNEARQWVVIIEELLREGQGTGDFRADLDPRRMAVSFNRCARGLFLDWCIRDGSFDLVKEGTAFMGDWVLRAAGR